MTDQVLPKIIRLRAERIAKVHFDEVYGTNDVNVVQGKLPDGSYVVVDLLNRKVVKAPAGLETELQKKVDAGIMAEDTAEKQGNYTAVISRDNVESTQPNKSVKKKVVKKLSTLKKSSRK